MNRPLRPAFALVTLIASLLFLLPPTASAQSGKAVTFKQRDAVITLQTNGDAQFVETWVVDFQRGGFTFAFREIPTNRLRDIVDVTVSEGDTALRTQLDRSEDKLKFTWYFPETNHGVNFYSDVHIFTLRYTVRGAARIYPDGDQFWWKFVEKDHSYPIESARAVLHLPATFSPAQIRATAYTNGRETSGGRVSVSSTIEFIGGPFPAQTEWELRAQFPHVITAAPEPWQQWEDRVEQIAAQNNFYSVVLGVVFLIGGPLLLLVLWYLFGRDKPTAFNAEFVNAPPDDTPPGVVGTLLDEHADLQDIVATVADLARRGYIRVREGDAFGTPEYERLAKPAFDLAPFESATLEALLRGNAMRRLEDVRGTFYDSIKPLETALYDEVVARHFFPHSPLATRSLYFKLGKWGAVLTPILSLCAYSLAFTFAPLALFPLFALEVFFIGLLGLSRVMPQRTAAGSLAYAKWNAFRRYLAHIEKYTRVNEAQDQFAKYLPYTIAFGLEKSWIDKFKTTTTPAPTWYIPYPVRGDTPAWSKTGDISPQAESSARPAGSIFRPGGLSPVPNTPIFSDSPGDTHPRRPGGLPTLNEMAQGSFLALNSVSGNMFDFLNTSAQAFTARPEARSASDQVMDGIISFMDWVGSSGSGRGSSAEASSGGSSHSDSSSSSDSSWSSSSSSDSGWSGGSSSGGGGGGGGSSGFG